MIGFYTILGPEADSSSIQRLGRSEVVHNVLHLGVFNISECLELSPGYLERSEEVDPLHRLSTGRGGEGPLVGAVLGGASSAIDGSHRFQEVHQRETNISERNTIKCVLDLGKRVSESSQGGVIVVPVNLKEKSCS